MTDTQIMDHVGPTPPVAPAPIAERDAVDPETFAQEVAPGYVPVVLRGQAARWPAVQAGRAGAAAMAAYIGRFRPGKPAEVLIGPPGIKGRFFYSDDMRGFNFKREKAPLHMLVAEVMKMAGSDQPYALYANAATADEHMPGWAAENPLGLPAPGAEARLWIGNATQVATHYDVSPNVAVVVAGKRRFTLFPPEQLENLYVGPLDRTLAGPPVSMVDPLAPNLDTYPRYAEALRHAQTAELEPGDAIFIPAIWWHHVSALDPLNVLVNYWWAYDSSATPFIAMIHAMMSVRDLPLPEKQAWKSWFDHYVFAEDAAAAADHLPEAVRGPLGPASKARTERIRAFLIGSLQPH